jgi:hypothetical protein
MIYVRPRLATELAHLCRCSEHIIHAMKMSPGVMNPTEAERNLWNSWFRSIDETLRIIDEYRDDLAAWKKPKPPKQKTNE